VREGKSFFSEGKEGATLEEGCASSKRWKLPFKKESERRKKRPVLRCQRGLRNGRKTRAHGRKTVTGAFFFKEKAVNPSLRRKISYSPTRGRRETLRGIKKITKWYGPLLLSSTKEENKVGA